MHRPHERDDLTPRDELGLGRRRGHDDERVRLEPERPHGRHRVGGDDGAGVARDRLVASLPQLREDREGATAIGGAEQRHRRRRPQEERRIVRSRAEIGREERRLLLDRAP